MKIFITGANRGIGLEFCNQLLHREDVTRIVATARHADGPGSTALNKLAASHDGRLKIVPLDLSGDGAQHLPTHLSSEGPFDWVINNAGVYLQAGDTFRTFDFTAFRQSFEINTLGPFKVIQALSPFLKKGTRIVNISSMMGSVGDNTSGGSYAYRSSKAALNMVNKSFAVDQPEFVSIVLHPGWVQTDMGGPNALITTQESVHGMIQVIAQLTPAQSGQFFDYEGKALPW
jgi:NAD(P)-dependent dehydrogenase (short-subunit alcohol dehydrogenase family)